MKDFESYAARERLESLRANPARKLTRQQRAQRRRFYRRTSAVFLLLALYALCFFLGASLPVKAAEIPVQAQEAAPMETPTEPKESAHASVFDEPEDAENEAIESALLLRSTAIENCTVTYYCAERYKHICGTGDGIAADGTPVLPWATCAVDPSIIPLGSTVMVDLGDGYGLRTLVANDTGVKGNHIDICVPTHDEALRLGIQTSTVYWCKE